MSGGHRQFNFRHSVADSPKEPNKQLPIKVWNKSALEQRRHQSIYCQTIQSQSQSQYVTINLAFTHYPTQQLNFHSKAIRQCKWRDMVAKFVTYASGTTWWPDFKQIQVMNFSDLSKNLNMGKYVGFLGCCCVSWTAWAPEGGKARQGGLKGCQQEVGAP